ncbi:hypothetical protein E5288_WYG001989 [Bos mutus]|uniref:Protein kinase domain-containing protein n=1 Tax=Bos mutus TaxID=72004 RepID=A0A6B0RQQ6_9CETA|nr:hypothetical protein [Bos mutus]
MEQSTQMQCIKRSALQGTLSYTLPPPIEMFLESNKGPGPKYDVYSFGIVIWEMLTQKKPYPDSRRQWRRFNIMTIIIQVATGRRPSLHPVSDEWSAESQQMVDLMRRCWDQEPKKGPAFQINPENVARLLVSHQADPNLREAEGKTPLHVATYFGHVSLVKLPTAQGAELDARQRNLRRPLHLAVERGKVRATQHLLKSGAAPDALDQSGYSPLSTVPARGKYVICKMLLRYGASLELPTQQGWTPLHLAAYKGHLEIIHLLAESQADVGVPGGTNWTPLHLAACHKTKVVVSTGWTPFHLAVQRGSFLSVIHLLEHRVDVHACNKPNFCCCVSAESWPQKARSCDWSGGQEAGGHKAMSRTAAQPWAPLRQRQQRKGTGLRKGERKRKGQWFAAEGGRPPAKDPRHLQPRAQTCDEPTFSARAPTSPAFAKKRAVPMSVSKVGLGWGSPVHTGPPPPPPPQVLGDPGSSISGAWKPPGERVDQDHCCG